MRTLAFATFLVWRLRTGGACGFWRYRMPPLTHFAGMQPMGNGSLVIATEKVHFALVTYSRSETSTLDCSMRTIPSNLNSTNMSCQGLASSRNSILWVAQLR